MLETNAERLKAQDREALERLLNDSVPEALSFIEAAASRMDRQIAALLEYSRLGARDLVPQALDLTKIVSSCLGSIAHQIERSGVKVTVGSLPEVVSDAFAIEQLLGNLLDNAVKYLDPSRPGKIEINGAQQGTSVRLEVKDNGRGVGKRDCERIFQVFVRATSADVPGVGMGLAEVQAIVRRLGGRVGCDSQLGQGTTFWVELPKRLHLDTTTHTPCSVSTSPNST